MALYLQTKSFFLLQGEFVKSLMWYETTGRPLWSGIAMCGSRSKEEGVSVCVDARQCPVIYVIIKTTPSQNKQGRSMMHPSAVQGLLSRHERPQPQSPEL